jgi:hypothetical protein
LSGRIVSTGSFFAASVSSKMRTRFLHTGPMTRSLTRDASISRPLSIGRWSVCSITWMAAMGAGYCPPVRARVMVRRLGQGERAAEGGLAEEPGHESLRSVGIAPLTPRATSERVQAPVSVIEQPCGRHRARDESHLLGAACVQVRPVRIRSSAAGSPINLGSRWLPPNPGKMPEQHFGKADLGAGLLAGHPRVARQRQLGAAAETDAVDRRHGRVGKIREPAENRVGARRTSCSTSSRSVMDADRVHVGAGDEGAALPERSTTPCTSVIAASSSSARPRSSEPRRRARSPGAKDGP